MTDSSNARDRDLAGSRLLMIGLDWPAVDTAAALGVETVVICSRASARAGLRELGDLPVLLVEDHSRLDDCLAALILAGSRPEQFDGVYTTDEFALGACNALAALADTSRLTRSGDISVFRDKRIQKSAVQAAGIATAAHWPIPDVRTFDAGSVPWPGSYVLKPAARAGTMHTRIVRDEPELRAALIALGESDAGDKDFLLESCIDVAKEWVVDGIVFDGRIEFLSISHYGAPPLQSLSAGAPMTMVKLDPAQAPEAYRDVSPMAESALSALGAWRGAFHMEIFWSPTDGYVFGECALRRGGAFTFEQLLLKYGFSIVEAAIRCALGRPPQQPTATRSGIVGTTQLLTPEGTILTVPTLDEFHRQSGVEFARYFLAPGSVLRHGAAHGTHIRTAEALVTAPDLAQFDERIHLLQSWFADQVAIAPPASDAAGLRAWQRAHFSEAVRSESTYGLHAGSGDR
ncbi:hypothetical protein [Plantibacter sp. ME-Dv--P-122b]|uniref:ATP-grasp domain-containing protein n=1 Tax=Plantibacter sp. ME-Dv--P-122b TaxID=3040300 RepID=UPI002551AF1A|nr:hypothetical protein [Plantibacter sp. ME-Dv--P-122b]